MKLDDVVPAHCYSRAQRLVSTLEHLREEMGRSPDPRPAPEIAGASPREVYFQAIAAWHKSARLADELHACAARVAPAAPVIKSIKPGHVLEVIDAVLAQVEDVGRELGIEGKQADTAIEPNRQPSDVLVTLVKANRLLSRLLERPFAPSDVYRVVQLALTYAQRSGKTRVELAPFERGKRPADCYAQLEACLAAVGKKISERNETALTARAALPEANPSDVYDLAAIVLGEVAFLHELSAERAPVHAFEPTNHGRHLPSHVFQLARTLEAQLASI